MLKMVRRDYLEFRKQYRPFLVNAKREMESTLQKNIVDTLAALAFQAGHKAGTIQKPVGPNPTPRSLKGKIRGR